MFLIPLVLGFVFNALSAPTAWFCRRLGERNGRGVTFVLRNVLGIPVWTIGLALAVRARSTPLFPASLAAEIGGWLLLVAGCVVMTLALGALRWRAALPSTRDPLIQDGPYAHVRHPIHCGLLLALAALVLLKPTRAALLASSIGVVWAIVQSRLEEVDLVQRVPGYRDYMARVPRFVPRVRRRIG